MAYNNSNNGCTTIWLICVVPIFLFALAKGCVNCTHEILKSSRAKSSSIDYTTRPIYNKKGEWGKNGVDPVLRTSTGGIYKDPNYPNYYFDITIPCHQCNGRGKWESLEVNPDAYDTNGKLKATVPGLKKIIVKCSACYGTGYEKQPIPSDGKIPLKPAPKK